MKRFEGGAFSLIEVVLALGICTFVLVGLMGLFSVGLKTSRESEDQVQAANLASQIIAVRLASPTNAIAGAAIPSAALTNAFGNAYASSPQYVGFDGMLTTDVSAAAYRISCQAGTNSSTGSDTAQVYLMLTWPAQAASTNASGRYETFTYITTR